MSGQVETAIRAQAGAGTRLPTPTGRATFGVAEVSSAGLVLLFGEKQTRTVFSWSCLEGIPGYRSGGLDRTRRAEWRGRWDSVSLALS